MRIKTTPAKVDSTYRGYTITDGEKRGYYRLQKRKNPRKRKVAFRIARKIRLRSWILISGIRILPRAYQGLTLFKPRKKNQFAAAYHVFYASFLYFLLSFSLFLLYCIYSFVLSHLIAFYPPFSCIFLYLRKSSSSFFQVHGPHGTCARSAQCVVVIESIVCRRRGRFCQRKEPRRASE